MRGQESLPKEVILELISEGQREAVGGREQKRIPGDLKSMCKTLETE